MIAVQLPDGTTAQFPPGTPLERIEAELAERFPAPALRPERLEPDETAVCGNGAAITLNANISRYVVNDAKGVVRGFRISLDEAFDLAESLPARPPEKKERLKPDVQSVKENPHIIQAQIRQDVERHIRKQDLERRQDRYTAMLKRKGLLRRGRR